ncbi:MAG: PKD domain-containing protein, partial [Candidatus Parabeggiatoa sp.]|nr:PKD domain-containing protein [Candidatus Parabeggiatoa sp.]
MKTPCLKLREGPAKRFLAYPAMALLLLMGSLPVSAQQTARYFTIEPTPAYGQGKLEVTLKLMPIGSTSNTNQFWIFSPGKEPRLLEGQNPQETLTTPGVHDIVLVVKDSNANMVTMEHQIAIVTPASGSSEGNNGTPQNQNPVADFTTSVDGFTVHLDGSKSSDPDNDPLTYQWKSGVKTATAKNTQIVFIKPGPHQITLTVTDNDGATATKTETVTVEAPNQAPVAYLTSVVTGFKVSLDGSGSSDPEEGALTYEWQASDGQTANGQTTELTFAVGSYRITLKVTDNKGATHSDIQTVKI